MTRPAAGSVFFSLVAVASLAASAPQVRDTAPPPQATGRIRGTVVGAESGRAVRFAKVSLESSAGAFEAVTDDAGGFSFERLRPGSYNLHVSKAGYLDTAYGQVRPGTLTPGKRIALADREQMDDVVVRLSQGGSISGVIRDDRGDPAYRANVRVSRWLMRNGVRSLEVVDSTETDERGRYRVSLLPPRDYVISAMPNEDAIPETKASPLMQGFAPVFYPGAMSARAASTISLALGEDRADVDFQMPLVALGRVTGTVLAADGRPAANVTVMIADREHDDFEQAAQTDNNGRFAFERVVPGTYSVIAGKGHAGGHFTFSAKKFFVEADGFSIALDDRKRASALVGRMLGEVAVETERRGPAPPGTASEEVTVTGSATSDVALTLEPPRSVAGRIAMDGASKPPAVRGTVVVLTAASLSGDQREAKVADDGTFVVTDVPPGKYAVAFAGEAPPWTLASAMAAGVDALDYLLEVPRDRDVRDLVLTLRDRSSELSGVVTDAASRPVGDRTIIVFPADERLWPAAERRIRAMHLAADGKYVFDELRPGSYLLALTDSVEPDEWLDPEFLRKLLAASIPVVVGDGEKRVQDLRIR